MALGLLSLIEPSNQRFIANGKVRRFHKRPRQILIPVLGVATAFAFAVGNFSLFTHRQYETKFPTLENLLISPVSSMMVNARICPIPLTVSK